VCGRIESIAGRMSGDRGMREGNESKKSGKKWWRGIRKSAGSC
jgi:hypothetical protein